MRRVCRCRANNSMGKDNNCRGRGNRGQVLTDSILRMIIRGRAGLNSSSTLNSNNNNNNNNNCTIIIRE